MNARILIDLLMIASGKHLKEVASVNITMRSCAICESRYFCNNFNVVILESLYVTIPSIPFKVDVLYTTAYDHFIGVLCIIL